MVHRGVFYILMLVKPPIQMMFLGMVDTMTLSTYKGFFTIPFESQYYPPFNPHFAYLEVPWNGILLICSSFSHAFPIVSLPSPVARPWVPWAVPHCGLELWISWRSCRAGSCGAWLNGWWKNMGNPKITWMIWGEFVCKPHQKNETPPIKPLVEIPVLSFFHEHHL